MHKLVKDITGQRFGRLTVLEYAGSSKSHAQWKCLCDCGKELIALGSNLRAGDTKSCGCLRIESGRRNGKARRLPGSEGAFRELYRKYKYGAIERNLTFELTPKAFRDLTTSKCYYCGVKPSQKFDQAGRKPEAFIYNGIDRVENSRGYTIDNCVPCCFRCNSAKGKKTQEEFLSLTKQIYEYLGLDQCQ